MGILHLFIKHTSAGITLNENYDPDVQYDMENALNRIVPEDNKLYKHTMYILYSFFKNNFKLITI